MMSDISEAELRKALFLYLYPFFKVSKPNTDPNRFYYIVPMNIHTPLSHNHYPSATPTVVY